MGKLPSIGSAVETIMPCLSVKKLMNKPAVTEMRSQRFGSR